MVKIKRMNKMLAVFILSASMIFATGTTAFAYVDESAEASKTESVETEETEKDTVVEENQINTEEPFSVPGNAQVQDDITNSKNKEFLTITTKNNNTFYLIIDRSANVDNVYMLSQIDENDLQEFLEDSSASTIVDVTPEVVINENTHSEQTEQPATESPEKEGTASNLGALVAILIAAILGVGAYGYMKFIKPKKDEDDGDDEGIEMIGESDPFEEDQESEDFDN